MKTNPPLVPVERPDFEFRWLLNGEDYEHTRHVFEEYVKTQLGTPPVRDGDKYLFEKHDVYWRVWQAAYRSKGFYT